MESKLHLKRRTTSSNEATHRGYKYGEDRLQPNHNLHESTKHIVIKGIQRNNKKKIMNASNHMSTSLWHTINSNASKYSMSLLQNHYSERDNYIWCRLSDTQWYVMRKEDTIFVQSF